ncbi:MAG: NAD(P)/FAD-dependent oxidoreductase [Candidatus Omnitrophica bacterium]|nr:NAD(P)/FAD-dependent oxidoreductase [Candidatus Omnitrophota bacterium]
MNDLIIGGSAAGVSAAEILRKFDQKSKITLISDERFALYSRCLLTYLIAGSIGEEKLYFKDQDFYQKNNIQTYLGKRAQAIDSKAQKVVLQDDTKISYDRLLLATGAQAKLIDVGGVEKQGVFTVRKIDDARAIIAALDQVKEIVVLGGGLIGLRDAYALALRKKKVTVLVKSAQVLSQMVDLQAAGIIAQRLAENGIKIMTGVAAKEILGQGSVEGVLLDSGERISAQMVIIGKGVVPNSDLASFCGLEVKAGIVTDEFLRSSSENIFAAGDVAETVDIARGDTRINALWPCAVEQGQIAALNMLGRKVAYAGSLSMNSVDFFGLGCISIGITKPKEKDYEILTKRQDERYKKFVLKNNRIVGLVLVGDIQAAGIVNPLIRNKVDISSIKDLLLEDNFNYAKILPLVVKYQDCFRKPEYQDTIISF